MDGCHLDRRMDGWAEGRTDGWMPSEWMDDGWMNEWMDANWMDGWMDGWLKTAFNRMTEYLRACSTFTEVRLTSTQPLYSSIFDIFASRLPFLLLK